MKRVLITGAGGTIGQNVIKYLLSEGKYEITAVDLYNKKNVKKLKRYQKRIDVFYGDILDKNLVDHVVKNQDIIIHLASCLPPLAEYKKDLANLIEVEGTDNLLKAINYYNPKCFFVYSSSTSIYNVPNEVSINTKIINREYDYYDIAKKQAEELISKKVKNYCIMRFPLVIGDLNKDSFIYSIKKSNMIEFIDSSDAAYAITNSILLKEKVNKKVYNIGGGETCRCTYGYLLKNILRYHGFSWNYLSTRIFIAKNYDSPILKDSNISNEILNYQSSSLESILMKIKRKSEKRKIPILFGKLFGILFYRKY